LPSLAGLVVDYAHDTPLSEVTPPNNSFPAQEENALLFGSLEP
jgi:hypothetical protein